MYLMLVLIMGSPRNKFRNNTLNCLTQGGLYANEKRSAEDEMSPLCLYIVKQ